jgi:hypothetical protein
MRSGRNAFGCNLVEPHVNDVADRIRELSFKGDAVAERVGVIRGDQLASHTSIR